MTNNMEEMMSMLQELHEKVDNSHKLLLDAVNKTNDKIKQHDENYEESSNKIQHMMDDVSKLTALMAPKSKATAQPTRSKTYTQPSAFFKDMFHLEKTSKDNIPTPVLDQLKEWLFNDENLENYTLKSEETQKKLANKTPEVKIYWTTLASCIWGEMSKPQKEQIKQLMNDYNKSVSSSEPPAEESDNETKTVKKTKRVKKTTTDATDNTKKTKSKKAAATDDDTTDDNSTTKTKTKRVAKPKKVLVVESGSDSD